MINTKRHSLVQFAFKSACFLREQILQLYNSFKHQKNKSQLFFEQGWEKF